MLLTEAEAKQKRCPMSFDTSGRPWGCAASECMAWRSAGFQREKIRNYADEPTILPKHGTAHSYRDGWTYEYTDNDNGRTFDVISRLKPNAELVGFCGIAGRVE